MAAQRILVPELKKEAEIKLFQEIIIPPEDEKKLENIEHFKKGLPDEKGTLEVGELERVLNSAIAGPKIASLVETLKLKLPKESLSKDMSAQDISAEEKTKSIDDREEFAVRYAEHENESPFDEQGNLKDWSTNFSPDIHQSVSQSLNQFFKVAYQAICDEKGEFRPGIEQYIGKELLATAVGENKSHINTIRLHLIHAVLNVFPDKKFEHDHPESSNKILKIIAHQKTVNLKYKIALNNLLQAQSEKKHVDDITNTKINKLYSTCEELFLSILKSPENFNQIPEMTKLMKEATALAKKDIKGDHPDYRKTQDRLNEINAIIECRLALNKLREKINEHPLAKQLYEKYEKQFKVLNESNKFNEIYMLTSSIIEDTFEIEYEKKLFNGVLLPADDRIIVVRTEDKGLFTGRQNDLKDFENGISVLSDLSRAFNYARGGKDVLTLLQQKNLYPQDDSVMLITVDEESTTSMKHKMEFNEHKQESPLSSDGKLKDWASKWLPAKTQQPLGHCINQFFKLAFEAICDEEGNLKSDIEEYFGKDLIDKAKKKHNQYTIRDYLITAAVQRMQAEFTREDLPMYCASVGVITGRLSSMITDCRRNLNELKALTDKQAENQELLKIYEGCEELFTAMLKKQQFDQIANLTRSLEIAVSAAKQNDMGPIRNLDIYKNATEIGECRVELATLQSEIDKQPESTRQPIRQQFYTPNKVFLGELVAQNRIDVIPKLTTAVRKATDIVKSPSQQNAQAYVAAVKKVPEGIQGREKWARAAMVGAGAVILGLAIVSAVLTAGGSLGLFALGVMAAKFVIGGGAVLGGVTAVAGVALERRAQQQRKRMIKPFKLSTIGMLARENKGPEQKEKKKSEEEEPLIAATDPTASPTATNSSPRRIR